MRVKCRLNLPSVAVLPLIALTGTTLGRKHPAPTAMLVSSFMKLSDDFKLIQMMVIGLVDLAEENERLATRQFSLHNWWGVLRFL